LAILLPVIWFYSLFDALQHHSLVNEGIIEDVPIILWDNINLNQRWVAYTLIGVGGYILFDNLFINVARYFNFLYHFNINTILVALIFIYIGFRLLSSTKQNVNEGKNV
jgi:predicted membrane protein